MDQPAIGLDQMADLIKTAELTKIINELQLVTDQEENNGAQSSTEIQEEDKEKTKIVLDLLLKFDDPEAITKSNLDPTASIIDGPSCSRPQVSPAIVDEVITDGSNDTIDIENLMINKSTDLQMGDDIYPMVSCPRGICMIINNVEFEPKEVDNRDSSHREAMYLTKMFSDLGFLVELYESLTRKQMINECTEMSQREDLRNHDAFIMVILTHGDGRYLMGKDGHYVHIETIFGLFNNYHCRQLIHKPKLFFVQACRGSKLSINNI